MEKKKEVGAEETQVWEDEEERLWLELPSSENSVLRSVPSIVVSLPRSSNASEPSPETGHVGWCWLALGKMGDAPPLPDAMAACMVRIRAAIDGGAK